MVQSLTYHDFKFYLTNFQKSRFAFYDADESLTKYLLIALFNISNTLTVNYTELLTIELYGFCIIQ